jgi:hypothetical protein
MSTIPGSGPALPVKYVACEKPDVMLSNQPARSVLNREPHVNTEGLLYPPGKLLSAG